MAIHSITKGLNLPVAGEPDSNVSDGNTPRFAALLGEDYAGMRPTMEVAVGDRVKLGQVVFLDKKTPGIKYTSPGAGVVAAINRGEKRAFLSLVIELDGDEEVTFKSWDREALGSLARERVVEQLVESGLWTTLRTRPFSKVPALDAVPHSLFVTAMDTHPLAPDVARIVRERGQDFSDGLTVLSSLTDGPVYVCAAADETVAMPSDERLRFEQFKGPHPSGAVGTHIHWLDPVGRGKTVWHIGAQDVIQIGTLFTTGRIDVSRIVSLAGPSVRSPRLVRTRIGTSLEDLTRGELVDGDNRIVSGSVLDGRNASAERAFLGRYHQAVAALREGRERIFIGWLTPGYNLFSIKRILASSLVPGKKFAFNTAINGALRSIVPSGGYEKVLPIDTEPTYLLRALAADDLEEAEGLGCLELDEEDLALCSFVCPSKIDHGANLRRNLTLIEKVG